MTNNGIILTLFISLKTKLFALYKDGMVYKVLASAARFFHGIWLRSLLRQLLVSENPSAAAALDGSVFGKIEGGISNYTTKNTKNTKKHHSFIPGGLSKVFGNIPFTSTRSFGLTFMGFGAWFFLASDIWRVVLLAMLPIGAVLVLINRSPHNLFGTSGLIKFAAGFFGFDKDICGEHRPEVNYLVFYAALGVILGGMFAFLDLMTFVLIAGAVIGGALILYKTEIGVFTACFLIPIAPTMIVSGIFAITILSYFVKLLILRRGEHGFKIGALGAFALLFAASLAFSVIIAYRPANALFVAASYILFIIFFFVAKNTLKTRRMIFAAVSILALSGLFVAAFGVYQRVTGNFIETIAWIDDEMFVGATARIYSTLENPNVLGKYLIFVIIISFAMLYYLKNPVHKLGALGIFGAAGLCMLFTQSRGAWLGLIAAFAIFALIHDRRLILLGIIGLLFLPLFLPEAVIERFLSIGDLTDTSTSYRMNIWLGSIAMIGTVWPSGIGPGTENFMFMYQEYAFHAVEAPHSHNLFLQVIIDQGVIGFTLFILLIIMFFKYLLTRYRHANDIFIKAVSAALAAAMFGYLVQGLTDNVWYNYRVVAFFWLILAIAAALKESVAVTDNIKEGRLTDEKG